MCTSCSASSKFFVAASELSDSNDKWTEQIGLIRIWFLITKIWLRIKIELWRIKINAIKIELYLKKLKTKLRTYWNYVGLFIKLIIHILGRIILQTMHHITIFFLFFIQHSYNFTISSSSYLLNLKNKHLKRFMFKMQLFVHFGWKGPGPTNDVRRDIKKDWDKRTYTKWQHCRTKRPV